jgi:hypothetical protein
MTVAWTTTFSARPGAARFRPWRANPALQNAETLWKDGGEEPSGLGDGVLGKVPVEDRGPGRLEPERHEGDLRERRTDVAEALLAEERLEARVLPERAAGEGEREERRERHDAEPPRLDQGEEDRLAEGRERRGRVDDRQSGHRRRARRGEERVDEADSGRVRRARQEEEPRADGDEEAEADEDDELRLHAAAHEAPAVAKGPEEDREDDEALRRGEPRAREIVGVEAEEVDGSGDPGLPAREPDEDDGPDDGVEPVLPQERAPVVAGDEPEQAEADERQEDDLEHVAYGDRRLGREVEAVLEEKGRDGEEGEQTQDDGDGPVELRPEASPGDRAPEVPHVKLRERSEEPPLGHRRECTFGAARNV